MKTQRQTIRSVALATVALLLGLGMAGASHAEEPNEITLPSGLDSERLKLADQGQQMRVYVSLLGYEDARGSASVFPGTPGAALGSVTQMNRRLMDMVGATRRFQVFDDTDTGIREESDIVITGQLTRASQVLERFLRGRKAITSVGISILIKNSQDGKLLDQNMALETYGQNPGEGALALSAAEVNSPEFQQRLQEDYQEAFSRALAHAAAYFESSMRPLAKVVALPGKEVQLGAGSRHGLQPGDEMVLFQYEKSGKGIATPLALTRCEGVGTETSTCRILRSVPDTKAPRVGDYAILSDQSLKLRFE